MIRDALTGLFEGDLNDIFSPDRWIILPPLEHGGMRRLASLQMEALSDLLPKGSPPIEIEEPAAAKLIESALASRSPNKTVSLVDLIHAVVEPPVDEALLAASAPIPLRVRVTLAEGQVRTTALPLSPG